MVCKKHNLPIPLAFLLLIITAPVIASDDGFRRVTGPCDLAFPADHGPHADYRTEWWYYTGNLIAGNHRRFGFQLTFFRRGLRPPGNRKHWPQPASAWRTDQIFLAHAAISDIDGGRHYQAERMARPVLSLAGTEQTDAAVTIGVHAWRAIITADGHRLEADTEDFNLALDLATVKPPVLHGQNGYSRKGQSPERASCYYSYSRLQAKGSLTVKGSPHRVTGSAWMDHEFSTAPLQPGITGWDWFSLQLSDQTDLMIFLLRQADGTLNPASSGTLVLPSGQSQHLQADDLQARPLSFWTSGHTGGRYPLKWRLRIDPLQMDLTLSANLQDQEMRTPGSTQVAYWEGSVRVEGTRNQEKIQGVGYLELTGYAAPFDAPM